MHEASGSVQLFHLWRACQGRAPQTLNWKSHHPCPVPPKERRPPHTLTPRGLSLPVDSLGGTSASHSRGFLTPPSNLATTQAHDPSICRTVKALQPTSVITFLMIKLETPFEECRRSVFLVVVSLKSAVTCRTCSHLCALGSRYLFLIYS